MTRRTLSTIGWALVIGVSYACQNAPASPTSEHLSATPEALPRFDPSVPAPLSPADDRPMFSLAPLDLTTSTFDSPLLVAVDGRGIEMGDRENEYLAREVTLVTWPEGEAVPTTVESVPRAPEQGRTFDQFLFTPTRGLEDRWYALRVSRAMSERFQPAPEVLTRDGIALTRFRVGRQVIVQQVQSCAGEHENRIQVEFSERVAGDGALREIGVWFAGVRSECTSTGERLDGENGSRYLAFSCPLDTIDTAFEVRFGAGAIRGLNSTLGVTELDGTSLDRISFPTDARRRAACRVSRGDEL